MDQFIQLNDGTFASGVALHIRSIPHLSLMGDGSTSMENNAMMVEDYKNEMANLLFQCHQYYRDMVYTGHKDCQTALEILWMTKPVERQPYRACIEIYVIVRAKDGIKEDVNKTLKTLLEFWRTSLQMQWFEADICGMESVANSFEKVIKDRVRAVVKEERMEPLPFRQMPECYAFDIIPHTQSDLHKLTGTLINYPNCAVSFQLMPTIYGPEEQNLLLQQSQVLTTMATGFNDKVAGQLSILSAEKLAKLYTYYAKQAGRQIFRYNMVVWGSEEAVTALSARVAGQLNSANGQEHVNTSFIDIDADELYASENHLLSLPWMINATLLRSDSRFRLIRNPEKVNSLQRRLAMCITIDECTEFFWLPMANRQIGAGMNVNETGRKSRTYADGIINAGDVMLGRLKTSYEDEIGLKLTDLAKHLLIVGTPGSGKTTFSVGLLDRLWNEHKKPFLVIEPAKNEYRALIQSIPELQIFTPGKHTVSPFVFNPFVPPKNVRLEAYKSVLKTAFAAGLNLFSPLDRIFEDTVNNCYSNFRWLDTYTTDDSGGIFNISDFAYCFQKTFESLGYKGDSNNFGIAGAVRLKSLTNLFDNYFSIPIEDLLTRPTVIELSAIENSDEKALIIALLLLSILSYVNANYIGEGGFRNLILLEEAHVLLGSSGSQKDENTSATEIAQELLKRMLAEIRSYGVGIAIADQSPRKVGIDIVALTDIKVTFRLVESQDKDIITNSTGMDKYQTSRLSKLKPGEAYLFFNKLEEPEEIITPDYRKEKGMGISISDDGISQLSTYWNDKQEKLRPYPQCAITPFCQHSCDYHRRLLAREVARRIFNKNFNSKTDTEEKLQKVFRMLSKLIEEELNDEKLTIELYSCIKVHLLRKIMYDSNLELDDITIEMALNNK